MKKLSEVLKNTSYPSLVRAVYNRIGKDSIEDVNNHGIDGGFNGFIYYKDTISFFDRHKKEILALAKEESEQFGQGMLEMIQGFNCLSNGRQGNERKPDYTVDEIAEALYGRKSDESDIIKNAMAWFAAEEVCRMFEE